MKETRRNVGNTEALNLLNEGWQLYKETNDFFVKGYSYTGQSIIVRMIKRWLNPTDEVRAARDDYFYEAEFEVGLEMFIGFNDWTAEREMNADREEEYKRKEGKRQQKEHNTNRLRTSANDLSTLQHEATRPFIPNECYQKAPEGCDYDVENGFVLVKVKEGSLVIPPEEVSTLTKIINK